MPKNKVAIKTDLAEKDPFADLPMGEVDTLYESNLIENEKSEEALEDAIEAWTFAKENMNKIDVAYALEIHRLLMKRLRPDIAGKFRTCDVWIGGQCKWFVSVALLKEQLTQLLEDMLAATDVAMNSKKKLTVKEKETLAETFHVFYEGWHGFEDGNGRSGRILYQIHRLLLGLPIKLIENKTKFTNYYPLFKKTYV